MDMTLMKAMRKLQKCLGWNDNEDFELLLICQSKTEGMKFLTHDSLLSDITRNVLYMFDDKE